MFKKFMSFMLAVIMVLSMGTSTFAMEKNAEQAELSSSAKTISINNDSDGTLIDSVTVHIDTEGNQWVEGQVKPMSWFTDNVLVVYNFYDMGTDGTAHNYEVGMTATALDDGIYFTYHELSIKPKNNTEYWTNKISHSLIDYKTVIGDAMSYYYADGGPSLPTVSVKGKFTLSKPIVVK